MTRSFPGAARRSGRLSWGAPSSLVAGAGWLMVWWHQRLAHGATQVNETNLVWGLTWMDSGKFLVPVLVLVLVGLASLYRSHGRPGRLGRVGGLITFGGLAMVIVATAFEFGSFPWGSYAVTFEDATGFAGSNTSGAIQALASVVFAIGLAMLGVDMARRRVLPAITAGVLVVGALTTVYLSPALWMPGAAWLVLGLALLRRRALTTSALTA